MKMPTLRFIVISSLLLFAIGSTLLTALHYKGKNNAGFIAGSTEEVRPKSVYIVAAAAATRGRGRRMVIDKTTIKNEKINVIAKEKHRRRALISGSKKVKFVAFTQDYYKPKHHPPKNN